MKFREQQQNDLLGKLIQSKDRDKNHAHPGIITVIMPTKHTLYS